MIVKMIKNLENKMEKMQELINKDLGELQWQATPVLLPGESQGRGSLVGCHVWPATYGVAQSHTTEAT